MARAGSRRSCTERAGPVGVARVRAARVGAARVGAARVGAARVGAARVGAARLLAGAVLAGATTLAACGSPQWTYVTNTEDGVYFKVPRDWQQVDTDSLQQVVSPSARGSAAAAQALPWVVAFDAAREPSATHLVAASLDEPLVFSQVLHIAAENRESITIDGLRNIFLPVTEEARAAARARGLRLSGFRLLEDEVVRPAPGVRGVHQVYRYSLGPVAETFDQTAYTTDDHSRISLLIVRCSRSCFAQRKAELAAVVGSFTVEHGR